eukprot:TRINITY_DN1400_c0_g1_i1.p1 TRINITY_DN1400_c0_g1~~TRINITY_DN1400_c0_g1_i1.p1  ORF type:complete len:342 (+),score=76.01 TRINITY_DN1400_c0_g1_i1:81-1106(+)
MHQHSESSFVGDEDTESEENDDSILYSAVDLEWMSHWQSWRNKIAWRHTWLSLKIASLEHELGGSTSMEDSEDFKVAKRSYRKKKTSKTATKPTVYVPAMNAVGDHPFLALQVPRKRKLQRPSAVKPRKRVKIRNSQQASNPNNSEPGTKDTPAVSTLPTIIVRSSAGVQTIKPPSKTPAKTPSKIHSKSLPASANTTKSKSSSSSSSQKHKSSKREDSSIPISNTIAERPRRILTPRPIIRNDFAQSDYKPLHDFWSASDDPDGKRNEISFQNPEIEIPEVKIVDFDFDDEDVYNSSSDNDVCPSPKNILEVKKEEGEEEKGEEKEERGELIPCRQMMKL